MGGFSSSRYRGPEIIMDEPIPDGARFTIDAAQRVAGVHGEKVAQAAFSAHEREMGRQPDAALAKRLAMFGDNRAARRAAAAAERKRSRRRG